MGNRSKFIHRLFTTGVALACAFPLNLSAQTLEEALDTTNLVWSTGGDAAWFAQTTITRDGIDAARSGVLNSYQTSWIETTVQGPATLHYFMGVVPGDSLPGLSIIYNGDDSEHYAMPIQPFPYWMEPVTDLAAGPQTIRWRVTSSYNATNIGYVVLDEFWVLPPRPLAFTYVSGSIEVYSGATAGFSAYAIGTPPLYYQWQKGGHDIPNATNANFTIFATTTNDAGLYSVTVSNSQGFIVSSNIFLTVLPPTPPFFTYEPASVTGYVGQVLYLGGSVSGSLPIHFQWRQNGTNLGELAAIAPWWGFTWLTLTNLSASDAGNYTLFVTNDYGSVESSNAVLTVIPSVGPAITKHPRSLEVAEGVNTWMSVAAAGDPSPTYKWAKVGEAPPPPPPGPPFPPIVTQPSQPKRSFNNVTSTNAGVYFATAKNYGGEVSSREALLTVLPPITHLNSWWQGAQDVFVTNGLAFLAQDTFGLAILSVSNPAAPVMLGGYNTPGHASGVCAAADWVYVVDGQSGLQILSVTNPFNPFLVGNYNTPYNLADVVVRSNLAYLADGKTGLLIVNVSNPAAPSLVGSFKTNFSADYVRVAGDFAYVSSRYYEALPGTNVAGFFVINIADPAHPFEVGRLARGIGRFEIRDQIAFGVTGNSLEVIALTNPAQPVVIGSLQTYNYPVATNWLPRSPSVISASDVQVVNDLAFVGGYSGDESRLFVVDVRDPFEPIPVAYYTNVGQRYALAVEGNMVYFAGIGSQIDIIQTPFAATPPPERLTLSPPPQMQLGIHGRLGRHYDLETSVQLSGFPWTPIQRLFLTNATATLPITPTTPSQFFRLQPVN
jgi:hypothetical protein